jgi:hypothetical protein
MSIQIKWVVINILLLCSTKDPRLKAHLLSHSFYLFILLLVFYYNLQHPFCLLANSIQPGYTFGEDPPDLDLKFDFPLFHDRISSKF